MPHINKPVPGAHEYYPLNEPAIGTALPAQDVPILFQPVTIKNTVFKNRIFVSPMCQYSSDNGHATDWHLVHVGGFATRGVGAICMEATAVVPEGRISPEDAGLWADSQMAPLERIVKFSHAHDTKIGVQLAHAGRKSSTLAPWVRRPGVPYTAFKDDNGWPDNVYGPSDLAFSDDFPRSIAMTEKDMQYVEDAFVAAIERCEKIGYDFIELHGAHGYLIHEFLSPLSNTRTDDYGGQSLTNRFRFPLHLIARCREAWPSKPLFVRISAVDWAEGPEKGEDGTWKQWGIEQSIIFAGELQKLGVDLIDCSAGGNWSKQKIPLVPGCFVPFAEALKKAYPTLPIGAVGLITDPEQAESYLKDGKTDVVFLARELLRTPHWPLLAAHKLGVAVKAANQYERAWAYNELAPWKK